MGQTDGRKPGQMKALPGSYEERGLRITEALRDAAILPPGDFWIRDQFADKVVVMHWSSGGADGESTYTSAYFEVDVTEGADGAFEFGEVRTVDIEVTEAVVPAKAAGAPRTKALVGFHLKALTAIEDAVGGWEFDGHFSVFDYEDHSRDIVRRGAMRKGLAVHMPKVLDHHGVTVGQASEAREDDEGLYVKGRIYPTTAGADLAKLMQPIETDLGSHAPVEQGSIGYSILEGGSKRRSGGGLELTDLFIWEVSPVTFADNDATRVGLKSLADVHTMPTGDLLSYAAEVSRLAVDGADGVKALQRRRVTEGRDLTDEQWQAADELLLTTAETTLDLLTLGERAGRKASTAQLRHTRAIIDGLVALVHGRESEPTPAPAATTIDSEDDEDAEAKAAAGGDDGAGPRAKALRGREDAIEIDLLLADLGVG